VLSLEPQQTAVEFEHLWYTWGDLQRASQNILDAINEAQLPPGSRIAVLLRNRVEIVPVMLALFSGDFCLASINAIAPDDKLAEEITEVSAPVTLALATDWNRLGLIEAARVAGTLALSLSSGLPTTVSRVPGITSAPDRWVVASAPDIAIEMLSSGTTGKPKRIALTRDNLRKGLFGAAAYEKGRVVGEAVKLRSGVQIVSAPFAHIAGITAIMNNILAGRRICLLERFSVAAFRDALVRHRPKVAGAPPAALRMLLDADIPADDFSSLLAFRTGTAPLEPEIVDDFYERYGIPVLQNYGATEFAGGVAGWTLEDFKAHWHGKRGSVGRLNPGIEGRVVAEDGGEALPPEEQGLLEVRGANVGDGHTWVRTTDLAIVDADRFLWIKGRADGAIIRGGFKILPEDVLRVLEAHPAVREGAVVALDDARLGQVPAVAWIPRTGVVAPDQDAMRSYLRQQLMPYQVPTQIVQLDELPRTPSLKVNQAALRTLLERRALMVEDPKGGSMEDPELLETLDGRVVVLTLNRPVSLNALNPTLMRRLLETVRRLAEDDKVGCIVLTGAGRGFCSGGDVRGISKAAEDRVAGVRSPKASVARRTRWLRRSVEVSRLLLEMPKVTIAMINGPCAGAGMSLAAACDFRIAAHSAKFVPAFVGNGMPGDYGGSWLWTHILGPAKARQLYLLHEKRSAEQALAFGLVDQVHPDKQLREKTMKLAHQFASLAPSGVAYAKANLNAAMTESFAESLDRESLNTVLARDALIELRRNSS
jgi:enoyl-CoA hydratase/carnithine racemase/acyl-CoA synthetase (AMP-forming)/AMP-acid ligase II